MKAETLTLKALFQKDVRYLIPIFQRPYVWKHEQQWEPLWDDVRNTAERYLECLHDAAGNNATAEEKAGSHFMGAVVVQQQPTAAAEVESRIVIDGQQRMTTMQLLADAAQEVMEELGNDKEAQRLNRLVQNAYATGDHSFKLWPTSLDQDAFRAAMTNSLSPKGFEDHLIVQAHDFFRLQIREWIEAAPSPQERADRIHGLETALFGLLELVVIDLATAEDAFVIFETLNARGTPLLASDLIKNYLLQTAVNQGVSPDDLYEDSWRDLETDWWRDDVRQGRLIRPRLDVFLNYWLMMRTGQEVPSPDVFPVFKGYVDSTGQQLDAVATDLHSVATAYRSFDSIDEWSEEGTFFYRWRILDAGVSTPLLLWLFSQPEDMLTPSDRFRCLAALESYLVRRVLCRLTTKDYNKLFLELQGRLLTVAEGSVPDAFVNFLAEQTADARLWPDDHQLELALLDLPLYRLLTRGRLRMVLEALEDSLRTPMAEAEHVIRGKLTIEHVLPQSWKEEHWPLPAGEGLEPEIERERLLHSLGNLTLVNDRLNPSLSNDPWAEKRDKLGEHTVLHLNKNLLLAYGDMDWTESTIRMRGADLAQRVATIWPRAQGA